MTSYERRQSIIQLLQKQPGIRVSELSKALEVTKGTIRNDLDVLKDEGILTRVHGGAVLGKQPVCFGASIGTRYLEQPESKLAIAQKTAELIADGDSILLDASTTVYYLAQQLENRHHLRIVTNGIDVARLLAKDSTNMVVLLGGIVNTDGSSVTGSLSEQIIRDLHVQKAFVSCSGLSLKRGLTDVLLAEAELKGKALSSAREVFALVDSSKIGKEDLTSFASTDQITHLYTDENLSAEWAAQLEQAHIAYTICKTD
ncbi:MAG: DeoR/GlpR family DNA-binding transcription regulator [Chloroflexi bacterium]|nr:DeoR/GlpR family DNA-binding transcription regulator [Chloroflexota bacterium]